MQNVQGWVEQGASRVAVGGLTSTTKVQQSFPGATVEVVVHNAQPLAISAISRTANVVTVTMAPGFGFLMGNLVTIAGVADTGFDGVFLIISVGATTFTYAQTASNASSSGGTAVSVQLATIYSDGLGTALANPFTAELNGTWGFFAANGTYDVVFNGTGLTTYTLESVSVGVGDSGVPSYPYASLPTPQSFNAGNLVRVTDNRLGLWFNTGSQWLPVSNYMDVMLEGAKNNNSNDDTTAINSAIFALSALGGGTLFFRGGAGYRITGTINPVSTVNLLGEGQGASVIQAHNCNAITFPTSTQVDPFGGIQISNLGINGNSCTTKTALVHASLNEFNNVILDKITVTNFNIGLQAETLVFVTIQDCWFQNINSGIIIEGQNLSWIITRCLLVFANGCGSGNSDGIKVDFHPISGLRPEGIMIVDNKNVFGFACALNAQNVIDAVVTGNSFEGTVYGCRFSAPIDFVFRDNYVEIDGVNALIAMWGEGQNVIVPTNIVIEGNTFITDGVHAGTVGFQLNSSISQNQAHVRLASNNFSGFQSYDIALYDAGDVDIRDNRCQSTVNAASIYIPSTLPGKGIIIEGNYLIRTIKAPFGAQMAQIVVGANWGTYSTLVRGQTTITNPAITATTTYASLLGAGAIPNFDTTANTGFDLVGIVLSQDDKAIGTTVIQSPAAVGQVVVNCTTTPGAASVIRWEVRMIQRYS